MFYMSAEISLRAVPLPEVPEYTEDLVFGHLGLPQGFDESRLLVNIAAFNSVRKAGGLGSISINC